MTHLIQPTRKFRSSVIAHLNNFKKAIGLKNLTKNESAGLFEIFTRLKLHRYSVLSVPFSLGRSVSGAAFVDCGIDPFQILVSKLKAGASIEEMTDFLYEIYKVERAKSAAEILGLPENGKLIKYPSWSLVLPWERASIGLRFNQYPQSLLHNRSDNGLLITDRSREGIIDSVYSYNGAHSQVLQTLKLLDSIRVRGYENVTDLPTIFVLVNKTHWRWLMDTSGVHRSYILSTLGYKSFEVKIGSLVYYHKANSWGNVLNGLYTVEEAQVLFDRVFEGASIIRGVV